MERNKGRFIINCPREGDLKEKSVMRARFGKINPLTTQNRSMTRLKQ